MADVNPNGNTVNVRNEAGASVKIYMNQRPTEAKTTENESPENDEQSTENRGTNSSSDGTNGLEGTGSFNQQATTDWMRSKPPRWPTEIQNLVVREFMKYEETDYRNPDPESGKRQLGPRFEDIARRMYRMTGISFSADLIRKKYKSLKDTEERKREDWKCKTKTHPERNQRRTQGPI